MVSRKRAEQPGEAVQDIISNPPLVPLTNQYLEDLSRRIQSKPVPWEGYARAELVSQDELRMIRSLDGKDDDEVSKILSKDNAALGDKYAHLYIRLLNKLTRTDTLQQILVLMGNLLKNHDERVESFLNVKSADNKSAWPWQPLVQLLEAHDDFCQLKAAQFLTLFLVYPAPSSSDVPDFVLGRLLSFISALIQSAGGNTSNGAPRIGGTTLAPPSAQAGFAEGNGADVGIQLLQALLRSRHYRLLVWEDEVHKQGDLKEDQSQTEGDRTAILTGLRTILQTSLVPRASSSAGNSGTSTPNPSGQAPQSSGATTPAGGVGVQMIYQVVFCLWLLSFDEEIASQLNVKFGFIAIVADVARNAVKEKVVRIIVAFMRNLIEKAPSVNESAMLGCKTLPLMEALSVRKWSDEEIVQDVEFVKGALSEKLKGMSTYDQYISELGSGRLTWDNPAHVLDEFWKENTARLLEGSASEETGDQSGLNMLLGLVKDSENKDATTLAVASNDLSRMLGASPEGAVRKRIDQQGGKTYIMTLLEHSDGQVKFYALNTVSKLVSASWRG